MQTNFYKDEERTKFIIEMKDRLVTIKPEIDEIYGNKHQKLFLEDYILYALLRNKKDFTKCSSDKNKAIEVAQDIVKFLNMLLTDTQKFVSEGVSEKDAILKSLKKWHYTGYSRLSDSFYFIGNTPLESLSILIKEAEEQIQKQTNN